MLEISMTFRSLREKTWTYGQTHGQYVPTAQQRDKTLDELEAVSLTIEVINLCGTTRWLTKPTSTAKHINAEQGQDGLHSEDQLATRCLNNATSTAIHIYTKQGQDGLHPEDQQATRWLNNATSTAIHIYTEQGQDGLHSEDQQATRWLNNAASTAIHIYAKQGQYGLHPEDQQATRWLNNAASTAIYIYIGRTRSRWTTPRRSASRSICRRSKLRPGDGE